MKCVKYYLFGFGRPCSHYIPCRKKRKVKRMKTTRPLIDIDYFGNWQLHGLKWRDLYIGEVIMENTYFRLYTALSKLLDYEMTGLSPEDVEQLKYEAEELRRKEGVRNG